MEQKKDEDVSIGQLVVGVIILAGAGLFIWGALGEDEVASENARLETVSQVETEPTIEPVIEIARLYDTSMSELAAQFSTSLNDAGNLIVDTDEYKLLIESKDGETSDYVEIQLKSLGECSKAGVIRNSDKALKLAGLKPDLKGSPTNPPAGISNGAVEYCDYPSSSFVVGTACMFNGGYYDVSISPRTYCTE